MRSLLLATACSVVLFPTGVTGQSWRSVSMSRLLEGNDGVRVYVEYAAGQFTLQSSDDGVLYSMNLRYDEDRFEPVADFSGDRLRLGVEGTRSGFRLGRHRTSGELDLRLARGVPMDLDLDFGAVRASLDFGGLALTGLNLSTGASESTIDISEPNPASMGTAHFEVGAAEFSARNLGNLNAERIEIDAGVGSLTLGFDGRWRQDARVAIDLGLGALELRVPEGLGVELRKHSLLTSLDSEGLVKRGDAYYSLDWETAARKISIDLDAAFGSVKVVWIR